MLYLVKVIHSFSFCKLTRRFFPINWSEFRESNVFQFLMVLNGFKNTFIVFSAITTMFGNWRGYKNKIGNIIFSINVSLLSIKMVRNVKNSFISRKICGIIYANFRLVAIVIKIVRNNNNTWEGGVWKR